MEATLPPPEVRHHPVFGDVPLVPKTSLERDGTKRISWQLDLDWTPRLPDGAVRGNPRRQVFFSDHPRYWYTDDARVCVQCSQAFVFTAHDQKHWYETLQYNLRSVAGRCKACRKQRRSEKALRVALVNASAEATKHPGDPAALLGYAEATVAHVERFGQGDLERAIALCRKALRAGAHEALYWEGRCQELAARRAKAVEAYRAFVEKGATSGARLLLRRAERRLSELEIAT